MDNFPEVYRTQRPLHDDWPWPFSKIPRRWTGLELAMPPLRVVGNAQPRWIEIQEGYPLAPDAIVKMGLDGKRWVWGMDPVHGAGEWSVQSFYSFRLKRRIPCYYSFSKMIFGRRLHFNGPIKPDVTKGDNYWWVECSLTWTKVEGK